MKYRNLIIFLVINVTLFAPFIMKSQDSAGQSDKSKAVNRCKKVEKLHRDKFTWMTERQMDSLQKYLHEDVLYIHSNGWIENKTEVIDNIKSGKLIYRNVDIVENTCRMDGTLAVITGKAMFYVRLDKTDIDIPLLYTEVYSLEGNHPTLFSRHACRWLTE